MVAKDRTGYFCAWRACSTACEVSLGRDLLVAAETNPLPNQRFIDQWTMLNVWQNQIHRDFRDLSRSLLGSNPPLLTQINCNRIVNKRN